MRKLLLLLEASSRDGGRWLREHLYSCLILGPIVLGLTYFTSSRLAFNLQPLSIPLIATHLIATVCWMGLVALTLSRASQEIYHAGTPDSVIDSLPVDASTSWNFALARRIARLCAATLVLIAARPLVKPGKWPLATILVSAALFVAITATAEAFCALCWVHWSRTRRAGIALVGFLSVLAAAPIAQQLSLMVVLSIRLWPPILILEAVVASILLYVAGLRLNDLWRASDIEYARRMRPPGRLSTIASRLSVRKLSRASLEQLRRDLKLTVRGFSSAVYVSTALALLWPAALVAALTGYLQPANWTPRSWLDASWLPHVMTIKAACILETCTIAALVPVLVSFELPHLWLERSVGSTGEELLRAKLWYARLASLPGALAVTVAGLLTFTEPAYYVVPLICECALLWWMVSSLIGALAYEMPARPGLSVVLMCTIGLGAGAITDLAWPVGILIYAQSMPALFQWGSHRANYYILTEAE